MTQHATDVCQLISLKHGAICWGLSLQFLEVLRAIIAFFVLNTLMVVVIFGEKLTIINRSGILVGGIALTMVECREQAATFS